MRKVPRIPSPSVLMGPPNPPESRYADTKIQRAFFTICFPTKLRYVFVVHLSFPWEIKNLVFCTLRRLLHHCRLHRIFNSRLHRIFNSMPNEKILFSKQSSQWKQSRCHQKEKCKSRSSQNLPFNVFFCHHQKYPIRNKKQLVADSENLHQLQYLPNYQVNPNILE